MSELKVNKETDFVKMLRYEKELETENEDLKQQNNELRQKIEKVRGFIDKEIKEIKFYKKAHNLNTISQKEKLKVLKELKSIIGESE